MKQTIIFVTLFATFFSTLLFSSASQEVFPSVLSSQNEIELRRPIAVKHTTFLSTVQLTNQNNCILTNYKKKRKEKDNHNIYVGEMCEQSTTALATLPAFKFLASSKQNTLTLKKKKQTFTKENLPSLNINKKSLPKYLF